MKIFIYLLIAPLIILTSCNFAAGSYPYAEIYEIDESDEVLIKAVKEFKEENPEYKLPNSQRFKDGKRDEKDHWYHIWFYYSEDNIVVKCWIRGKKIAFVGLGDGLGLANYKEINKDFSSKENKKQKEKFEKLILNRIKTNIH